MWQLIGPQYGRSGLCGRSGPGGLIDAQGNLRSKQRHRRTNRQFRHDAIRRPARSAVVVTQSGMSGLSLNPGPDDDGGSSPYSSSACWQSTAHGECLVRPAFESLRDLARPWRIHTVSRWDVAHHEIVRRQPGNSTKICPVFSLRRKSIEPDC